MPRQMAGTAVVLASMQLALIACGGKSPPAPVISAAAANGVLPIQWNSGFKVMTQALRIDASGQLELSVHNHFIDDSGRADYDFLEMLTKVK